jgi:hypothetical protein
VNRAGLIPKPADGSLFSVDQQVLTGYPCHHLANVAGKARMPGVYKSKLLINVMLLFSLVGLAA